MKLIVDNQLAPFIAEKLRDEGFDCIHVAEVGMWAAKDEDILALAEQDNRIVITGDNDYPQMMAMLRKRKPSIIFFKINQVQTPYKQISILRTNLTGWSSHLAAGCIVTIERNNTRIRTLPILPPFDED